MYQMEVKKHWESAAAGWVKWEDIFTRWTSPATEVMLDMAGVVPGAQVLDLACGAGSQTFSAARRVGTKGYVVACDISETMVSHVREKAYTEGFENISTIRTAAEDLDVPAESFDAAICRIALMLFVDPAKALSSVRRALKPGGRVAAMIFTTPETNAFMAKPMQVLLRHAGKKPPTQGKPGIFSLGKPDVVERLFSKSGFSDFQKRVFSIPLKMKSADQALLMLQEAAGAYRAVVSDCSEEVRIAAWAEVKEVLKGFETENGFEAPGEVVVASGAKV